VGETKAYKDFALFCGRNAKGLKQQNATQGIKKTGGERNYVALFLFLVSEVFQISLSKRQTQNN